MMKQLVCEMCGGTDLVKKEGVFVCQSCGCKYSAEEAQKLMVEITNNITVDKKLEGLFAKARDAADVLDAATAYKYYEEISIEDPSNWEALLFSAMFKIDVCELSQISACCINFRRAVPRAINLLNETDIEEESKRRQITRAAIIIRGFSGIDGMGQDSQMSKKVGLLPPGSAIQACLLNCSTGIESFADFAKDYIDKEVLCELYTSAFVKILGFGEKIPAHTTRLLSKIEEIDPSNNWVLHEKKKEQRKSNGSGGCYVATCVYGSYDCPQVWTLRRFRDYELAETWYGRAFIKVYYAVSPTLVQWFGDTEWFKNMWRGSLNRLVAKCRRKGFNDTPYSDRIWK